MKRRTILIVTLILTMTLLATVASAQEDEEVVDCKHPRVVYLVEKTRADCQEILDLHSSGVGFGQIVKAAVIAEGLEGFEGDWRDLLAAHQEEIGWGQIARAYGLADRYADLNLTGEELLALKTENDLGWGQIRHAQAIAAADLGVSFDQAVSMMVEGMEWEDIRDELGLPEGPPPWAGGGNKDKETGPPAWAGGGNKDKETGPPAWANNDKDKEEKDKD
jgi:hypothetical protein